MSLYDFSWGTSTITHSSPVYKSTVLLADDITALDATTTTVDGVQFTSSGVDASSITCTTVSEASAGAGVTVEGTLCKDGDISTGILTASRFRLTSVTSSSSTISTSASYGHYRLDTTSNAITITLSTSDKVDGRTIYITDSYGNAATNNITIDTGGSETIRGLSSTTISSDYGWAELTYNSSDTDWVLVTGT